MEKTPSGYTMLSLITFIVFTAIAILHVIFTNLPGNLYAFTKVLLMPSLCLFFAVTVSNFKKGFPIPWALTGLWLGNICLLWGEQSKILFTLGSATTIIGFFGYIYVMAREVKTLSAWFIVAQLPILWFCGFFVLFMHNDLGRMLVPISLYMTLIAVISITGLAQLMQYPRSFGAWMMFAGTLCYIAENGLYTADHYMQAYHFGVNIVHPFFIMAQTFVVCGYLLRECEQSRMIIQGTGVRP